MKAYKNSGDALNVLPENSDLLITASKETDGILKSQTIRASLQMEPDDMVKYGTKFPKVTAEMVNIFNEQVHCGTPSAIGAVFNPINMEHRKAHPAREGKHKGEVLFYEEYDNTITRADGVKMTVKSVRAVGGEPKYSSAALKQLKNLAVTLMQERNKGIDMKDVAKLVNSNGFVIHEVRYTRSDINVAGNRPTKVAEAQAKAARVEKQNAIGEASKKHMEKVTAKAQKPELVTA